MSEPIVFEPVTMKCVWDCGVSCLQMLLGVSYSDVRKQIRYKNPTGLSVYEMRRIAKTLGHPLSSCKDIHTDDIGIVFLDRTGGNGDEGHYVIFAKGVIYNPAQGQIWTDPEAYVKTGGWRVVGILKRRD